jgi:hypothetical protein
MPLDTFKIGGYMKKSVFILALIFGINFPVDLSALEAANELLRRVDSKLMPESYEAYRRLINEEPNGKKKEYTFFTLKKGTDKVAIALSVRRLAKRVVQPFGLAKTCGSLFLT